MIASTNKAADNKVITNVNAMNWGFFRNDASAKLVQDKLKKEKEHVQRVADIGADIDVYALPKDQVQQFEQERSEHRNQMYTAGITGTKPPEKLKSLDERKAEYRDILIAAAVPKNAEKPAADVPTTQVTPVVSGTLPQNGIRFMQQGKEISALEARDRLSTEPPAAQGDLETQRDRIFTLLERQKELSAQARYGKSLDEQQVIAESGIEGQVMATHIRQQYAEMTETAVAQKDMTRLLALEEAFMDMYGTFTLGK